jgi:hypothetical protein
MHRILTGSVVAVLISLTVLVPGSAAAKDRANAKPQVFVRVEGASATLLPQTAVTLSHTKTIDGETCSGTSAAGGLTLATHNQWTGTWSPSFSDFLVNTILGEAPASGTSNFWTLWVNGRSSQTGACSTKLKPGDHELWFDCLSTPTYSCSNNPLALRVPAAIRRGHKVTVKVAQLDGSGHSTPFAGAVVRGGGSVVAVTGTGGTATFVPKTAGLLTLQAVKSGATPSDPQAVCVFAKRRSQCKSLSGA